jgi:dihydroorotate dehydrogenase (NAD+) catalytic subunit
MGGITTVQDVLEFISCGAEAVAVGSAAFREPSLAGRLAADLRGVLAARGYTLAGIRGLAHSAG